MNKKLVVAFALILVGIIGLAYASYWIYSNIVTITPSLGPAIHLNTPTMPDNATILIKGNLTKNGLLYPGTIMIYNCTSVGSSGALTSIANITSIDGTFAHSWKGFTIDKQYWFIARYQVMP